VSEFEWMNVRSGVNECVWVYECECVCVSMYVWVCMCEWMSVSVCALVCLWVWMCLWVCVSVNEWVSERVRGPEWMSVCEYRMCVCEYRMCVCEYRMCVCEWECLYVCEWSRPASLRVDNHKPLLLVQLRCKEA